MFYKAFEFLFHFRYYLTNGTWALSNRGLSWECQVSRNFLRAFSVSFFPRNFVDSLTSGFASEVRYSLYNFALLSASPLAFRSVDSSFDVNGDFFSELAIKNWLLVSSKAFLWLRNTFNSCASTGDSKKKKKGMTQRFTNSGKVTVKTIPLTG